MKTFDTILKYGVGVVCAYEAFSIGTGLTPTVSHEVGVLPWLGPIVLVSLGVHFYWPQLTAFARRLINSKEQP